MLNKKTADHFESGSRFNTAFECGNLKVDIFSTKYFKKFLQSADEASIRTVAQGLITELKIFKKKPQTSDCC